MNKVTSVSKLPKLVSAARGVFCGTPSAQLFNISAGCLPGSGPLPALISSWLQFPLLQSPTSVSEEQMYISRPVVFLL